MLSSCRWLLLWSMKAAMAASSSPPEEVVFQQDAVFQCLVPTLDLALGLRIHRRATDALHAFVFVILRQIPRDVGRAIITQKPGIVQSTGTVAA